MQRSKQFKTGWYIFTDALASAIVWIFSMHQRKVLLHIKPLNYTDLLFGYGFFYESLSVVIIFWLALFAIAGAYNKPVYKKLLLDEFSATFLQCIIGCLLLMFILFLNDTQQDYIYFYKIFFTLFVMQAVLVSAGRFIVITRVKDSLKNLAFNTLIIGSGSKAIAAYNEIKLSTQVPGFNVIGYVGLNGASANGISDYLSCAGTAGEIEHIIPSKKIEQVVVAIDNPGAFTEKLISSLSDYDVDIKLMPDTLEILSGAVKTSNVNRALFIDINTELMPAWQSNIKRLIDVGASITAMIILSPLILYILIRTKLSSPGKLIYTQQRVGFKGKPFNIYKFRSMYEDAERNGPMLSSENDERITKWGKTMRKWRLDEIPQLLNILSGDMSFVGPRPERKFYIDAINKQTPYFRYLLKVKPGLTSWGMVKFGYASSVEEMIRRMKYDLVYIENVSLLIDLKIMLFTLKTIFLGKGK